MFSVPSSCHSDESASDNYRTRLTYQDLDAEAGLLPIGAEVSGARCHLLLQQLLRHYYCNYDFCYHCYDFGNCCHHIYHTCAYLLLINGKSQIAQ